MDLFRLTRRCATAFVCCLATTSIAVAQNSLQNAAGYFVLPNIGVTSTTGSSYSERGGFVFDVMAGRNLHEWTNIALTGAASISNTFTGGSDLTCAIGVVTPGFSTPSPRCGAHAPKLLSSGFMVGVQTSSDEPVLFAITTGPAYVHGTDYYPSDNTISAAQNAFGIQSRMDLAIRVLRPVWVNFSGKSLLMPNYQNARLHNKSASIGIRLQ